MDFWAAICTSFTRDSFLCKRITTLLNSKFQLADRFKLSKWTRLNLHEQEDQDDVET